MKPIPASAIAREVAALNLALARSGADTRIVMVAEMRRTAGGQDVSGRVSRLEIDDDWEPKQRFAPMTEREALISFGQAATLEVVR